MDDIGIWTVWAVQFLPTAPQTLICFFGGFPIERCELRGSSIGFRLYIREL